jgi:GNAT superfamily N-acetyltransferase
VPPSGRRLRQRLQGAFELAGVEHHDLVVLRGSPPAVPSRLGRRLDCHTSYGPEVLSVHEALGRVLPEWRLRARFEHGLQFFVLWEGSVPVASTWAVSDGEQFVDEVGFGLRTGPRELVIRDVHVPAALRGRGLFRELISAVLHARGQIETVWSVVERNNRPSVGAHMRLGLRPADRFLVLHLWRRVMIRLRWPRTLEPGTAYRPTSRVVRTGRDFERLVQENLA